jgi:DNA-binding NtrC family response regulator
MMALDRPNWFERTVVLAVSGSPEELEQLQRLFAGSSWSLQTVGTVAETEKWLGQNTAAVVLCNAQLPDGDWKDILQLTAQMDGSANLVVASRRADERLWAEVLNLGGYDVLALPANATELFRTVSGA